MSGALYHGAFPSDGGGAKKKRVGKGVLMYPTRAVALSRMLSS